MTSVELYPHQIFGGDFRQIKQEATRQEEINAANHGELKLATRIMDLVDQSVGDHISTSDWLFEGCLRFANELAPEYFDSLLLNAERVVRYQKQLHSLNDKVLDMLAKLKIKGKAPGAGSQDLVKASDFVYFIEMSKLDQEEEMEVTQLLDDVIEHETLQMKLTLHGIADMYEIGFPRVMFVLRRALKVQHGWQSAASDERVLPPSSYLDWISRKLPSTHVLMEYFGADRPSTFYKTSRNVASHHRSLRFDRERNSIVLPDDKHSLEVPLYEFQQRYRYLNYLVDYGVRGILYHFALRDSGEAATRVCKHYERTFPRNLPELATRAVKPYE